MKTLRYAFWAIVALCLILVGLANRGLVTVRAMPSALSDLLGLSPDVQLPLFVVIFLGVGAGLLIGFLWEWVREFRLRARGQHQRADRLRDFHRRLRNLYLSHGFPSSPFFPPVAESYRLPPRPVHRQDRGCAMISPIFRPIEARFRRHHGG